MALTLIEAAKQMASTDPVRARIMQEFGVFTDLNRHIPITSEPSGYHSYWREGSLPTISTRGYNEAFTTSSGTVDFGTEGTKAIGVDFEIDTKLLHEKGPNVRDNQLKMALKGTALEFSRMFIKGDATAGKEFDGLQRRATGSQLIAAGSTAGGDSLSLSKMDEAIDAVVSPSAIVLNLAMKRNFSAAARSSSIHNIEFRLDEMGKQVGSYNGIPFIFADEDEAGNQILPFTEAAPGGGSSVSTSVYVVSFGEEGLHGFQSKPLDWRMLGENRAGQNSQEGVRVDWYIGLAANNSRCISRIHGITNTAVTS